MGETQVKGANVGDGSVGRPDLNIATAGQAVITRILEVANSGIKLNASTGIDSGTGDISLILNFAYLNTLYQAKLNGTGLVRMTGTTVSYDNTVYYHSGNFIAGNNYSVPHAHPYEGTDAAIFRNAPFGCDANTLAGNRQAFTYAVNAPNNGALVYFGDNYGFQINTSSYSENISFRSHNGDAGQWHAWRDIWHTGNAGSTDNDWGVKNLKFDQTGTRSWNILATGGVLRLTSGDGSGNLTINDQGVWTAGNLTNGITTNQVPVWNGSKFADSLISSSGTAVYIGSSAGKLRIIQADSINYFQSQNGESTTTLPLYITGLNGVGGNTYFTGSVDVYGLSNFTRFVTINTTDGSGSAGDFGLKFRISNNDHTIGSIVGYYTNSADGGSGNLGVNVRQGGILYRSITFDKDSTTISGTVHALTGIFGSNRPVVVENSGVTIQGDTGGWAFEYGARGSSGSELGGFGFTGGVNVLDHYYIGTFASQKIQVWGDGSTTINGQTTIRGGLTTDSNIVSGGHLYLYGNHIYGTGGTNFQSWNGSAEEAVAGLLQGATIGSSRFVISQGRLTGNFEGNGQAINDLGVLWLRGSSVKATISECTSAPIEISTTGINYTLGGFAPALHQTTVIESTGYVQHLSMGLFRNAGYGWSGGMYIGLGGADAGPVEYFKMNFGGSISHSAGHYFWHSGNLTNSLSYGAVPVWNNSNFQDSGFSSDIGYPYNRSISTTADVGQILIQAGSTGGYVSKINVAGRSTGTGIQFYTQSALRLSIEDGGISRFAGNVATGDVINLGNGISVSTTAYRGITWESNFADTSYAIFKPAGAWVQPLHIAFYTGIKIGAVSAYGGTKFYNTTSMVTELMSVGDGDNNVRIQNNLFVGLATSGSHTSPAYISTGETYSDNTLSSNCKIKLHDSAYGFGIGNQGNVMYHSGITHDFYVDNVKAMTVSAVGTVAATTFSGSLSGTASNATLWNGGPAPQIIDNTGSVDKMAAGLYGFGNIVWISQARARSFMGLGTIVPSFNTRGETRLFRREHDSDFSVQTYYDGVNSTWRLDGYNADTFHAGCIVAMSDYSANSAQFNGKTPIEVQAQQSSRDFPNGTLIQSSIDYSAQEGAPFLLEIIGNTYGQYTPMDLKVQGYIYANTLIQIGGISNGLNITGLVAFNYGGKLCFWFPNQGYWHGYTVFITDVGAFGSKINKFVSTTREVKPTAITKEVALSPSIKQSWHTGNLDPSAYIPVSDSTSTNVASTVVRRDANGFINATYYNSSSGLEDTSTAASYIFTVGDGYFRKKSLAATRTEIVTSTSIATGLGYTPSPVANTLPTWTGANVNGLQYWQASGNALNPDGGWWWSLRMAHGDADTYYSGQMSFRFSDDRIVWQRRVGGTLQPSVILWTSGNAGTTSTPWNTSTLNINGATSTNSVINKTPGQYGTSQPVYEDVLTYAGAGGSKVQAGNTGNNDYGCFLRFVVNTRAGLNTPVYALELRPEASIFSNDVVGPNAFFTGISFTQNASGLGFNRRVADGAIYNGSMGAFQIQHTDKILTFQTYNGATSFVFNGTISADGSGIFAGGGFNSLRSLKKIHEDWNGNAISVIDKFKVRDFNYNNRLDYDRTLGFIIDEVPDEIGDYVLLGQNRDAINTYTLHALSFKAHQEENSEIDTLKNRVKVLEEQLLNMQN